MKSLTVLTMSLSIFPASWRECSNCDIVKTLQWRQTVNSRLGHINIWIYSCQNHFVVINEKNSKTLKINRNHSFSNYSLLCSTYGNETKSNNYHPVNAYKCKLNISLYIKRGKVSARSLVRISIIRMMSQSAVPAARSRYQPQVTNDVIMRMTSQW